MNSTRSFSVRQAVDLHVYPVIPLDARNETLAVCAAISFAQPPRRKHPARLFSTSPDDLRRNVAREGRRDAGEASGRRQALRRRRTVRSARRDPWRGEEPTRGNARVELVLVALRGFRFGRRRLGPGRQFRSALCSKPRGRCTAYVCPIRDRERFATLRVVLRKSSAGSLLVRERPANPITSSSRSPAISPGGCWSTIRTSGSVQRKRHSTGWGNPQKNTPIRSAK